MAEGRDVDAKEKFNRASPDEPMRVVNEPKAKELNERTVQEDTPLQAEKSPKRKKSNPFREEKGKDGKTVLYVDGDPQVVGAAGVNITAYDRVEFSNGMVVTTAKARAE